MSALALEVGRLVGLLPIELARAELARKGLDEDEKAVRRIAGELGAQMLATRTRDLMRFRAANCPLARNSRARVSQPRSTAAGSEYGPLWKRFASAAK